MADNILLPGNLAFKKYVTKSPEFVTKQFTCTMPFSEYLADIVTVSEYKGRLSPQSAER